MAINSHPLLPKPGTPSLDRRRGYSQASHPSSAVQVSRIALASLLMVGAAFLSMSAWAQSTPYGSCPERADVYQARYERTTRAGDLVCMQKAMERELNNADQFDCPLSAQHYQEAYEARTRTSDLVCMQQALEREMR